METESHLPEMSVRDQLHRAARDLWSQVVDVGDDYVVFIDRRNMQTRVERTAEGVFQISWQDHDSWIIFARTFENPREAALHAYQGPHE